MKTENGKRKDEKGNSKSLFTFHSSLFTTLPSPLLDSFDEIIQGVQPLNSRQLQQLPDNIRSLSHQLTDERSTRRLGYMNDKVQLSSYVRYYTWWNLVRLTRLFANLPKEAFPAPRTDDPAAKTICLDLGSGPLTVVIALWLARPDLRPQNLTWYCLDVSANGMALGEDIYLSTVARTGGTPWKIIRVKGSFGTNIKEKADFITCANMFNELDQASDMPPEFQTKKYYEQLKKYAAPYAKFILIEPGVPKASRTIALLRDRFLKDGNNILAPCPHAGECPMNGFKAYTGSQHKWCNFAFSTEDAPAKLQRLSERAKLPKERATLCFIAVTGTPSNSEENERLSEDSLLCRITSDEFTLPGHRFGHYACSSLGLTLLTTAAPNLLHSGDLLKITLVKQKTPAPLPKDAKSGAVRIDL